MVGYRVVVLFIEERKWKVRNKLEGGILLSYKYQGVDIL